MKIALVSARPRIADKKANLATMQKYLVKTKADLFVFGELFLSGYRCKDELRDLAESIDGPTIKEVQKLIKKQGCHVIFGMPLKDEKRPGLIYNASVLLHPDGQVDVYKKWFLPTFGPFEEKIFFDEGETLYIHDTKIGKIGLAVCYDLFFPEIFKAYSLQGADLIVCISATPSVNREYFETLMPARAIENTTFLAYVNIVGTQEDLVFWGGSQLYDPFGKLLVRSPYFKEKMVTYEIDFSELDVARAKRPVLRDIRPQIYQDLYNFSRDRGDSIVDDNRSILDDLRRFHGHLGPYVVVGWKAGKLAEELLGNQLMKAMVYAGKRPYSCMADGIQLSSHCTVGKGNIEIKDKGVVGVEFCLIKKKGAVKILLKTSVKKEIDKKMNKATEEQLSDKILKIPNNELFDIKIK